MRGYRGAVILLVTAAVALRLALAWCNRQANDDHLQVARIMAYEHRVPLRNECWECFQPKLYHGAVAALIARIPAARLDAQIVTAQMVSACAGLVTLWVVWLLLASSGAGLWVRLWAWALAALNPALLAINVQATNDSLVIMCATLAWYAGMRFFARRDRASFVAMTAAALAAGVAKSNGLVAVAVIGAFLVRRGLWRHAAAFALSVLLVVSWAGMPLPINQGPDAFPRLTAQDFPKRPGITSLAQGYGTFRFIDLLRHPKTDNSVEIRQHHRTSLWSQLYGRLYVLFFDQYPSSWETRNSVLLAVGRMCLVLGLVPTCLFLAGWWRGAVGWRRLSDAEALVHASVTAYLVFIVAVTLRYREFYFFKPIYLFPALAGGTWCCLQGLQACRRYRRLFLAASVAAVFLLAAFAVTEVALLIKLWAGRFS